MAPFTFFKFVRDQRTPLAPVVKADLTGKTVVVTGASAGLGFEATKHFATMNPGRLILACRNQQKGEAAISDIQSSTGFSRMELWIIDLNDFTSVKTFADRFDNEGGRLDILVENAGISPMNVDERTKDGWLGVFQTNFIAPALLAYRLLPHMLKTAQDHSTTPRIVVVTSELHYWSTVHKNQAVINSPTPLKALSSQEYSKKASPDDEYMDSKLLNVLFVRDLQKRLLNPTVTVDSVNPGFCQSQIRSGFTGARKLMTSLLEMTLERTTEAGSRQLVYAALGGTEEEMGGGYVNHTKVDEPSDFAISAKGAEFQNRIHAELLELLPLVGSSKESVKDYLKI